MGLGDLALFPIDSSTYRKNDKHVMPLLAWCKAASREPPCTGLGHVLGISLDLCSRGQSEGQSSDVLGVPRLVAVARTGATTGAVGGPNEESSSRTRAERNCSQADLAERLEVSRQSVNAIETGKFDPSLPQAFRLARLFEMTIEQIFVNDDSR
jgi:putative transcriptional regulator